VTLDTTRADKLGCYGNAGGLTPALDAFASRAVLFERCESPSPHTAPAHATVLSGWNPARHGVRRNFETRVPQGVPLLAEELRGAGYQTGAFVSAMVLLSDAGFGRGFDTYDQAFFDPRRPEVIERRAEETLAAAAAWMRGKSGPWFCWIHLYDPHYIYRPPEPWASRHAANPYDGEIAYMDASLGRFLSGAEADGALARTAVVICSDHGESLGEHGEDEHGIYLYEATTHVLLLVRTPGLTQPRRVAEEVGLVDIAPTVRDLCGLPPTAGDGVSLSPALRGEPFVRPPVLLETLDPFQTFGWAPLYAAVDGGWKYILAPRPELYRLADDPGEKDSLLRREPARASRLRATLKTFLETTKPPATAAIGGTDEELKALQSLGYIGAVAGTPVRGTAALRDPKDGAPVVKALSDAVRLKSQGRVEEAASLLEGVRKTDPRSPRLAYLQAECLERREPERALKLYAEAAKNGSGSVQPYVRMVSLLNDAGRYPEAMAVAREGEKAGPDYAGTLHTLWAWSAFGAGRPEAEVVGLLDQARTLAPERPLGPKLRALLALRAGKTDEALAQVEAMARISPPDAMAPLKSDPAFAPLRQEARFWAAVLGGARRGG